MNLLKRHVLKRCIYGVDLNPMAVELAKVSLWLDAFTLGAPLSFLDHHLRCGNSLIGATFDDLKKATEGQLFSIDYQPLLKAIEHVLLVNAMADATASEVHESVQRYGDARKALSGYKIVFDLLVADHFLIPNLNIEPSRDRKGAGHQNPKRKRGVKAVTDGHKPSSLLAHASELDLKSRDAFVRSLRDDAERKLVVGVEQLADRPDRRFFHWEIEFPEVFFGFEDSDQRRVKHRNETTPGSAGFDAVVGNPPYVRQESITPLKVYLQAHYATYDSTNDLYVYFQEREVAVLRADGRMGMIVANKWMRAGYGKAVRRFLQRVAQPLQIIDFGHSPIFPDADTFPCIPIVARRLQGLSDTHPIPDVETTTVCSVPREHWDERMNLSDYVRPRRSTIPTRLLRDEGWSLEDPRAQDLLHKVRNGGETLASFLGLAPLLGIKTGYNEAFLLTATQKDMLLSADQRSAAVVRPLLRGRDVHRWQPQTSGVFLITIASSENHKWAWTNAKHPESSFAESLPAVCEHLRRFEPKLRARQDQGRYWWELRSCDYYDKMLRSKLLIQSIAYHSVFCLDTTDAVPNNSLFFLPTENPWVLAVLNSSVAWWFMFREFPHKKDEAIAMDSVAVARVPIPPCPDDSSVRECVQRLFDVASSLHDLVDRTVDSILSIAGSTLSRDAVRGWFRLPTEGLLDRLAREGGRNVIGPGNSERIAVIHHGAIVEVSGLLGRQLEIERNLGDLVENSFGLTPDERKLLRETRPVRDPLDVLEAKIAGRATIDAESDQPEGENE